LGRPAPESQIGFAPHLRDEPRGKQGVLAPGELVEADLQPGARLLKLALLLVQQAHRFAQHLARVRESSLSQELSAGAAGSHWGKAISSPADA
jgi:hypothetical protein